MLPLPNLDDRKFEEIVLDARKRIPKQFPQWTDENYHDPGITMLELFSWLIEMQQFYLDQVTEANERKFLKMLGIRPREAQSAQADVTFGGHQVPLRLPKGTKLRGGEQTFETDTALWVLPQRIERVIVRAKSESVDYSPANDSMGGTFFAFGEEALLDSRVSLAFDGALPVGQSLAFTVALADDYPVPIAPPLEEGRAVEIVPSAKVEWSYYGQPPGADSPTWLPLQVLEDETQELTRSGQITFVLPTEMRPTMVFPANDKRRFWIRGTVVQEGFELPPKVKSVSLNTITAVQVDTKSEVLTFDGTGLPGQVLEADDYLAYFGQRQVLVQEDADGRWREWKVVSDFASFGPQDRVCRVTREEATKKTRVLFGDGLNGALLPKGSANVRLVVYADDFAEKRWLGASSGLPGQRFELPDPRIRRANFRLLVSGRDPVTGEWWQEDWERVDDFDSSGLFDRHYRMDEATNEVVFGDHEKGLLPERSDVRNVWIAACSVGGGERGNVKHGLIDAFAEDRPEFAGVTVTNLYFAAGGAEAEGLDEAKARLRKDLKSTTRAVSAADYEEIVRATPGLRVARVKALPLYTPGLRGYPDRTEPAQMTVVVVPYSTREKPVPSTGFLQTVKRHVEEHRLLTTEVHVVAPAYVKVTVHAIAIVDPAMKEQAEKVVYALSRYLDPIDDEASENGWDFGRTVFKGDVYGVISRLPGVDYVEDLWLDAEGDGYRKNSNGDILLPPHGLVYSGAHEITLVSRDDV